MKASVVFAVSILAVIFSITSPATTYYVDVNSTNPTPPYSDWSIAATNIQDAIDASADGDAVLVTNGVYRFGGAVMAGDLTNRVALNKAITVQSVNGPWATIIQGNGQGAGPGFVRCAWLTNGASLVGFTLSYGGTRTSGDTTTLQSGGGVWCASSNAIVANCVIATNAASYGGAGVFGGTINNCLIRMNGISTVPFGSAANGANLNNCTITSNSSSIAVFFSRLTNCIVYSNPGNYNASSCVLSYCCTTPLPPGVGNFTTPPQFFDGVHLSAGSPCIHTGTNLTTGTDLFGKAWANPPSVGCAEWTPEPLVSKPQIKLTGDPVGFTVTATGSGQTPLSFSWLRNGTLIQNDGHFSAAQTTNLVAAGVTFSDAGTYQLIVSNAFGVITGDVAQLVVHCVDLASANPVSPYLSWATAATNIQDAITVALPGEVVLVTNGFYATGGKSMDGTITNRVSVDKAIIVQSVNGPIATVIQGAWDPISTNGVGAVRCAWLTNNATLSGFTLFGGATQSSGSGGGVVGPVTNSFKSPNAIVFNCIIVSNAAASFGGGVRYVSLINCALSNNVSRGSGGGAEWSALRNCVISGNAAISSGSGMGGGADNCALINCAIVKNFGFRGGGGAYSSSMVNCTVTGNSCDILGSGGGVSLTTLTNCIVYGNTMPGSSSSSNSVNGTFAFSCTAPLAAGNGNISADPLLLPDGIHLSTGSPCIGAGASVTVFKDIDGQIWNNPPSIGCDEWQPAPVIGIQPSYQVGIPAHSLSFGIVVAGQAPFSFFWSKDGSLIQDDGHFANSGTANLVVNNFGPDDVGSYQVIVSNAFGVVTSAVANVVIHTVNIANANPVAPYSAWATAATNIQDAIDATAPGDIVLVTNGIYATGGKVMAGDLLNRVALDKPVTVVSVNGYQSTVIQGVWDPASTNGPGAVRCAWLTSGAVLNGFTLQNGATRATGNPTTLQSGGGVWGASTNAIVSNCVLTNNQAINGGGIAYGTLQNSLITFNAAAFGGGAYFANLNNCTVVNNYTTTSASFRGAGTYDGVTKNSIVVDNYDNYPFGFTEDNYSSQFLPASLAKYSYSCTRPYNTGMPSGAGNINANTVNLQMLDLFHIASTSPCRGAGNPLYASGNDLDGEPWSAPPSMGCDEVVISNLVGPLSVSLQAYQPIVPTNHYAFFGGYIMGKAANVSWSFGDGSVATNTGSDINHFWTNSGDYTVTFTAYNLDNPLGVSASTIIHVMPLLSPQLQTATLLTNGFQFQFTGQTGAIYTVQFATNLAPPVTWQNLQFIGYSNGGVHQITDLTTPTGTRFYRVLAQ
jgi:hypothetical protein